ncbi:MAG TPA: HAD hydrolase-like protein [Desulfobaccales bacterium]|nr:HAD hydrolase-like protein [Desulfobaccales bacterium]
MPQLIIYDCDGVLIDSRESNRAFYNHILDRFGLPPLTEAQLAEVHVLTAPGAIDFLFQGHPDRAAAQTYQKTINNDPFLPLIRLEPYIREVLIRLRSRCLTAIATNRGKSLPPVLHHLGLADLFDLTISAYDVTRPKPHPECLLKILTHFRLPPEAALYIGDSQVDQEVAAAAKVPFAAYQNPGLQARHYLQDHLDLLAILRL